MANTTNDIMNEEIVYPELSYEITGLFFKVHNKLGRFCREKQYCDELEKEFEENGISFKREFTDKTNNRYDFVIEGKIVIECKAKHLIDREDYYQPRRYLQASGHRLGMLVNFRSTYLKPKRVLNPDVEKSDLHHS